MRHKLMICCLAWMLAACGAGSPPQAVAPPEIPQWLATLDQADDDRDFDRRLAALQLGVHRVESGSATLARHLKADRDPSVRAACAYALGRLADPAAREALLAARADDSRAVRLAVVEALAARIDDQVLQTYTEMAKQNDHNVLLAILRALASAGRLDDSWKAIVPSEAASGGEAPAAVYVDPARGDDAGDGSEPKPFRTVRRGLASLAPGGALFLAGIKDQPIREAVVIPAALSGHPQRPTRFAAWPNRPRPLLSPTTSVAATDFARQADGRWRARAEQRVFGAFLPRGPKMVDILAPVATFAELQPQTCWWDAEKKEVVLDLGAAALPGAVELALAEDALLVDGARDVLVSGIDVRYAPDSGFDAAGARRVSFVDCRAEFCDRHGFFFYYSPDGLISGGYAAHNRFQGMSVRSSPQTLVLDSTSRDNGIDGFLFLYDSDNCLIVRGTAAGNFRGVSFIEGSDYGRVLGGDYTENRQAAISFESGSIGGQVAPLP